ncbi:Possible lysine decarboxylase [seawater metagenome]|uniref:Possible lysine decarboxylase n=1 Tax=seawater metagenome TaxID=1561972 RepID=A0A5E8CL79_9ZZZZ
MGSQKTKIGVIGGSKKIDNPKLLNNLKKIGESINIKKNKIQYGGGSMGMMSIVPKAFYESRGEVLGINWQYFKERDTISEIIGKEILFDEFRDRQHHLIETSDIFLCLPGGIGTLSEVCDILIKNSGHIWENPKKLIIYNFENFYDPLEKQINNFINFELLHFPEELNVHFVENVDDIIKLINQ